MKFIEVFKRCNDELPKIERIVKEVYFISNNLLYKGYYHMNGTFYSYKDAGSSDCIATPGGYRNYPRFEECTHWCYIKELEEFINKQILSYDQS